MSEPLPTTPTEAIAYQPISGWAIAGCATGALFALLTLLSTAVALWQGAPMFFPLWVVGVAVLGIVLSLIGQRHVENSEGTRAGAKLARVGVWLSLISGLCYLSYYFVTGLAVTSQANDFLLVKSDEDSGFFPRLGEGATDPVQLNQAFLLTVPGNQRSARPDNEKSMRDLYDTPGKEGSGNLSQFKYGLSPGLNGVLPSVFFKQNAKDVKVEAGAVQEWSYEQKSYKVRRKYHIETKEVNMVVSLQVVSSEAESAGQGRKWHVALPYSQEIKRELTPFGSGMRYLRVQASATLAQWVASLNEGKAFNLIKESDKTDWDNVRDDLRDKRAVLYDLFTSKEPKRFEQFNVHGQGAGIGKWEEVGGKTRIHLSFRFALPRAPGQHPAALVDAIAVYETERDINPAEVDAATPLLVWRLKQIIFTNLAPIPQRPGG